MSKNMNEIDKLEKQFFYIKDKVFKRAFKNACKEVAERLVDNTPHYFREVDTSGRTKRNWNVTFDGTVDASYDLGPAPDVDGEVTKGELKSLIENASFAKDMIVTFANSTPWIMKLEYGMYPSPSKGSFNPVTKEVEIRTVNGFSKQALRGIRAEVELAWEEIARNAINS